jgi:16S rRNA U516 pseudouridylate synthase RsuA-like enzyme
MTAKIGHPTLRLIRVGMGNFTLEQFIPGKWNYIEKKDIL